MKNGKFNFHNPKVLLEEIKTQRIKLKLQAQIELNAAGIVLKSEEIKRLQLLKKPFDDEIAKFMVLRDKGVMDRFAYREILEKYQPQQLELMRKISSLTDNCNLLEAQIGNYSEYVKPAEEFFTALNTIALTYSIVEISLRGEFAKYLLVPDKIRRADYSVYRQYLTPDIQMLAIDSGLGEALLGQVVGQVPNSDYRFRDLFIEKTEIASDEILRSLSGIYVSTQMKPIYRLQSKTSGGGAFQRWRDGARSDA